MLIRERKEKSEKGNRGGVLDIPAEVQVDLKGGGGGKAIDPKSAGGKSQNYILAW